MKNLKEQRKIINSKAFRRLSDKTQVLALDHRNAQVRTRMTHSLEVASIGQEISSNIGKILDYKLDSDLVYNVCLLHDIGMPPLGHLGEVTLNEVSNMLHDIDFEANANNLVIIEKSLSTISALTIVSTIKYPFLIKGNKKGKGLYKKQYEKYIKILKEIIESQNQNHKIEKQRTYESEIMEVSDDLAYLFSDLEDYVSITNKEDRIEIGNLKEIFNKYGLNNNELLNILYHGIKENEFSSIEELRNKIISSVGYCKDTNQVKIINDEYQKIMRIFREIEGKYYLSKHSLSVKSEIVKKYREMLMFLFNNLENKEMISEFILSSSLRKKYKKTSKKEKNKLSKILLIAMSELTDTYLLNLINMYFEKYKDSKSLRNK